MKVHVILWAGGGVAFEETVDDVDSTSEAVIYALGMTARRYGEKCSLRCEATALMDTPQNNGGAA